MPGWGALLVVTALASGLAAALTALIRSAAIRVAALDEPNSRSLHTDPVPRGGGAAIVLTGTTAVVVWWWLRGTPGAFAAAAGVPLVLLAVTGWLDDRFDLPRRIRFGLQLVAAVTFIAIAGVPTGFEFGPFTLRPGMLGAGLAVLWIVWVTNLYNFMDGIDGLAAMQGIIAATTAGFWFYTASDPAVSVLCFVIAGACFGFLHYNWAPARIFLGDVGSLSLGGLFALLGVYGVVRHAMPCGAFILLLGVFVADSTVTLLRRMIEGEKWWEPHRSHYYQRLVLTELSHVTVTTVMSVLFVLCAVLASLEVRRVAPRALWYGLAAMVLIAGAIGVNLRERARR